MPKAVLQGLKHKEVEISAICAMLDTGGSSGRLREDYGILAPGDIRRAFIALANTSPVVEDLFNYRFEAGELKGHNFANLFISALELSTNNREKVIEEMSRVLNISHEVLPVTLQDAELCAELSDGSIVRGEANIDVPQHNMKIKKVFLDPLPHAYPKAIKAIEGSDIIVIGPGDIYSSLAQVLLTEGIKEAVKKSKGKVLYICNLMNKNGETNDFKVEDFTEKIEEFLKTEVDYVLYNNKEIEGDRIRKYEKKHPELVGVVSSNCNLDKKKFVGSDLVTSSGEVVHHPQKVADLILTLCK